MIPTKEEINTRFGNAGNSHNPVFEDVIGDLITAGLYTSALEFVPTNTGDASADKQIDKIKKESVFNFKNPDGDIGSVSLDVLVHAITKNVIKGFRDGFTQLGISKDGASNVSYSINEAELALVSNIGLKTALDVNQALFVLAQEIAVLKRAVNNQVPNGAAINPNLRKLDL